MKKGKAGFQSRQSEQPEKKSLQGGRTIVQGLARVRDLGISYRIRRNEAYGKPDGGTSGAKM